jgi:hypothetical protein
MNEDIRFNQHIFSDGKVLYMSCNYNENTIELRLEVRKFVGKQIVPCTVSLRFIRVIELDVLDGFDTTGNYSDVVLKKLTNGLYASFDPFGNSGEPNENDNFVIKAENCVVEEV